MRKGWWIVKIAVFGTLAIVVFGWITMTLWNWLVPALFSGPMITFWQALGLLILSKILFSGFGKKGHHYGGHWRAHHWKEKWTNMTPDERERFKEKLKAKWCYREPEPTSTKESGTSNV
jgi:hypothetical protein